MWFARMEQQSLEELSASHSAAASSHPPANPDKFEIRSTQRRDRCGMRAQMYLLLCKRKDACFHGHQDEYFALRDISRGRNASAAMWEYTKQVYGRTYVASVYCDPVGKLLILGHVAKMLQPTVVPGSKANMQITLRSAWTDQLRVPIHACNPAQN